MNWDWMRSPHGVKFVASEKADHDDASWAELRQHACEMVRRCDRVLGEAVDDSTLADARLRVRRWLEREARAAFAHLHHLPAVADAHGGVLHDLEALRAPDVVTTDALQDFLRLVLERLDGWKPKPGTDDDPWRAFRPAEMDGLTAFLSLHLTQGARPAESLFVVIPDQPVSSGKVREIPNPGESWFNQYEVLFLTKESLRSRLVRHSELAREQRAERDPETLEALRKFQPAIVESHPGRADDPFLWFLHRWDEDAIVEATVRAIRSSAMFALLWHADASPLSCVQHAQRSLELLAGLTSLAGARPSRTSCRLVVVGVEEWADRPQKVDPPIHADTTFECVFPDGVMPMLSDGWWWAHGHRFAFGLHEYATQPKTCGGRFRRALHFWSRGEAFHRSSGGSAFDVADRYLAYMTAIEVAISSRSRVTASVSQRVANICRNMDVKREMKDLYDVRSRYVHDGLPRVKREELVRLRELARLVLRDLAQWSVEHSLDTDHVKYVEDCDLRAVGV